MAGENIEILSGSDDVAVVTTATKLTDTEKKKIKMKIKRLFPLVNSTRFVVEKNVIAGIKIEVGDYLYDDTVYAKIHKARRGGELTT